MEADPKRSLRSRMRALRAALAPDEHTARSLEVQRRFLSLDRFGPSERVAIYAPVRNEVSTDLVFRAARASGKQVLFPKVRLDVRALAFYPVDDLGDLVSGTHGILEPEDDAGEVPGRDIDLIAVPALAFDATGHRLGYGGGYYDRLLAAGGDRPRWATGLAFEFQLLAELPLGTHDRRVDQVLTEHRTFP